jgi:hypothetical protein
VTECVALVGVDDQVDFGERHGQIIVGRRGSGATEQCLCFQRIEAVIHCPASRGPAARPI